MNKNDLEIFATLIADYIKKDAEAKHLTGQFRDSIRVDRIDNGFRITIDPKIYNLPLYLKTGVVQYKSGGGSYANQLDRHGSFKNNHFNYVSKAIKYAYSTWKNLYSQEYKIKADFSALKRYTRVDGASQYEQDVKSGYYNFETEYLPSIFKGK